MFIALEPLEYSAPLGAACVNLNPAEAHGAPLERVAISV